MSTLTELTMTLAERRAFARLTDAVGFAPRILFGRDRARNNHLLQRVVEAGTPVLYAITAPTAQNGSVREYRLLITPVRAHATKAAPKARARTRPVATKGRKWTPAQRRAQEKRVRALWAARKAKRTESAHAPKS